MASKRDEFSKGVREILAHRAGFRCSKPDCRASTAGPSSDGGKRSSVGIAAHITAAAPGGPRYDASLISESRKSVTNGIWLCDIHAREVDNDADRFTAEILRAWKFHAEEEARAVLGRPLSSMALDANVEVSLQRDSNDGVLIIGETNLPEETKLMGGLRHKCDFKYFAQAKCQVHDRRFVLGPFSNHGDPLPQRWYEIEVYCYFNGPWQQSAHVIDLVGADGAKLAGRFADPLDPDLEDSDFAFRAEFECPAPQSKSATSLGEADVVKAIELLRSSTLDVEGNEVVRSADPVGTVVDFFIEHTGMTENEGWSSIQISPGLVEVSYAYQDGSVARSAKWHVIPSSKEVRYRNRNAKILSWMPAE